MRKLRSTSAVVFAAAFVLVGCMNATNTQPPTHRWAANDKAVDTVKYHNDHARCQVQAGITADNRASFGTSSPEFKNYKQCMNNNGYVLTAYNQ